MEDFNELFLAWKRDPVTVKFYQLLHSKRELLKEQWAHGGFGEPLDNARALGAVDMLNQIEEIEYEDFTDK